MPANSPGRENDEAYPQYRRRRRLVRQFGRGGLPRHQHCAVLNSDASLALLNCCEPRHPAAARARSVVRSFARIERANHARTVATAAPSILRSIWEETAPMPAMRTPSCHLLDAKRRVAMTGPIFCLVHDERTRDVPIEKGIRCRRAEVLGNRVRTRMRDQTLAEPHLVMPE
jgi:hypothetical protein